ncbi:DUF554 domain-containing protein [Virgibacillus sp. AGTR]|uniref:DUF554 domain-containing protein n=1 Tax=Virgibacillus salarius TaxID=447199 RepID=A0A941IAL9_9BACI|nr:MULTISPECIES: DUF554 domain-containing protein [Bacillaceae]NAZ09543.1 DUF554 family protein [Agaribacter marinus]MBR7796833.1 DUF554 domain-containing protein [Virgibacillus salarius]MCC2252772.1 DUF554 domain-containing protein [Virgibacillus sp. AGTR]QRZ18994.1 DUF554 domain-containing protein [Virgibacillus sp. AGTR]WBX81383.1 DUF554 domain-containing protein [Virgibacillus salarius]
MALYGTIINGVLIIIGSLFGLLFTKIPERYKETVMQGIGLAVMIIGVQMALSTELIIIVLLSLLTGAILGELLNLEVRLNSLGTWIGSKFTTKSSDFSVSQGFVTASLIFVIGAMSVIGALDSGIRGDHEVLITKGILDGFVALVLTTTLGFGVILSVIPVVLYQGSIALLATQIEQILPESFLNGMITELTAVGGVLILAIGFNLLKITSIRIGNLLPAIITVGFIYYIYQLF